MVEDVWVELARIYRVLIVCQCSLILIHSLASRGEPLLRDAPLASPLCAASSGAAHQLGSSAAPVTSSVHATITYALQYTHNKGTVYYVLFFISVAP